MPGGFGAIWHGIVMLAVIGVFVLWRRGWFS